MKSILLTLGFFLISLKVFSQGNDGLIAHWNFNGNANDVSGHHLDGVVTGATLTAGYKGVPNTAYYFNGIDNHIDVAFDSLMNIDSAFSICTLVQPIKFYNGSGGRGQGNFILTRGVERAPDYYNIEYCDNAYKEDDNEFDSANEVFCTSTHGTDITQMYTGNTIVNLSTWYCVTVTCNYDSVKIFVDGVKKVSVPFKQTFSVSTYGIAIGYNPTRLSDFPFWVKGIIDDIRLYRRALSEAEVSQYCDSTETYPLLAVPATNLYENHVVVYPNPFSTQAKFLFNGEVHDATIRIVDVLGKVVEEYNGVKGTVFTLYRNSLQPGIYFCFVKEGGQTLFNGKLVIQ